MRLGYRKFFIFLILISTFTPGAAFHARYSKAAYETSDALETLGISVGVGSVLGLSTIGFYGQPHKHLGNVFIGAGAGLLVGLGIVAYMLTTSPKDDAIRPEELIRPKPQTPKESGKDTEKDMKDGKPSEAKKDKVTEAIRPRNFFLSQRTSVPAISQANLPALGGISSLAGEWVFAWNVLELRF
jgi:hypothetical protein